MRVFVTGATGFLGRRVVSQLRGHELLCLSRKPREVSDITQGRIVLGELAQPRGWMAEVERFAPQWCVHLAWEGLPDYSLACCRANLEASIRLIESLADAGAKRIVIAGTCWEYGDASGAVTECGPESACGVFAATKHALRLVLESFARERGIEYRWARIFFAYGPGQRSGSLIPQCYAAYSQGRQPEIRHPGMTQDFVYVDDVAEGIVAITHANAGSGVFNVGSGVPATVASVVNRIAHHFGAPSFLPLPWPASGFWADTTRTTASTGWKANTTIDTGIALTLRALESQINETA